MDGGRVEEIRGRQQEVKCQYERFIIYYVTTHWFNNIAMQIKFLHYSLYIPLLWKNWYDRFMGFDSKHFTYMYNRSFSSYITVFLLSIILLYSPPPPPLLSLIRLPPWSEMNELVLGFHKALEIWIQGVVLDRKIDKKCWNIIMK